MSGGLTPLGGPGVVEAGDAGRFVTRGADERGDPRGLGRADEVGDPLLRDERVLGVHDDEVEAGVGADLRDFRSGDPLEAPEDDLSAPEALFEPGSLHCPRDPTAAAVRCHPSQ